MVSVDDARSRVRALALTHATIAASMAHCLREPPQVARRLAWRAIWRTAIDARRNRLCLERLGRGSLVLDASEIERARLAAFARYAQAEQAPKIVASIHAIDLVPNALKALDALPSGMRVHMPVPSRSVAALEPVARLAARLGKSLDLLPLKSASQQRLRRLDRGDVVFILLDLDTRYGRTVDVRLFGDPARIACGPFALARRLGASMVYLHADRGELELDAPHDACVHGAEHGLEALATHFARRIERSIATAPTRWTRWHTWPQLRANG